MTATLQLNQLLVMKAGKRLYDQPFHRGLNIIRGSNGSGKSTIADFIFYSLGGELEKWKEHARRCDEVIAEFDMSGVILTLRREIDEKSQRPMRIFFGPMDLALASAADGWIMANFARDNSEKRQSFSQILFKALNLPEIPGDAGANITMHQILRLMYVDQTSPFQRIFRAERFDAKDTKEAISELLCGIGGGELYALRIQRRTKKAEYDEASSKYTNLSRATTAFEENFSLESIDGEITVANQTINALNETLEELETSTIDESATANDAAKKRRELYDQMSKLRAHNIELERLEKSLILEIDDSSLFVDHLKKLLEELDSAAIAFSTLGSVEFAHCPACFSTLKRQPDGCCHLCGNEFSEDEKKAKAMQVRLDLEGQIKESLALQVERQEELTSTQSTLRRNRSQYTRMTKVFGELSRAPVDGRTAMVSQTSRQIGNLDARVTELEKLKEIAKDLANLGARKQVLNDELSELDGQIEALERSKDKRRRTVLTSINENTKYFLRKDMQKHTDFERLDDFAFNFEDDWFAVNGDPNISTSASGMVMLKNCLMLGILKSALEDHKMMFPRFIIQDNGEDKGMVSERVRHFQQLIADWSNETEQQHQIILTTSTLNPDLDDQKYVVGPSYSKEHRTLDFAGVS